MKGHLKGMGIAAATVLIVLLAVGVRPGSALPWAAALACPLMMIAMMGMMHRRGHDHGGHATPLATSDDAATAPSPTAAPTGR